MKRSLKAIITTFAALALVVSAIPGKVEAAASDTAYLAYGNSDWSVQWGGSAGTSNTEGATGGEVQVTGAGQYTVDVDFTATATGLATGTPAFIAPVIMGADKDFPGYFVRIDSVEVNGEAVEFTKGYTNDEGDATRMNLYNIYVTAVPDDDKSFARSYDGDTSDSGWNLFAEADVTDVATMSVTFTFLDADGNDGSAAAADDAATPAAAPKTGVIGLGIVYGLGALATGSIALKRKHK
jgi:hypothetical protein